MRKPGDQPLNGVFVAIGHRPNTELFSGWVALDERGYIALAECRRHTATSVPGSVRGG